MVPLVVDISFFQLFLYLTPSANPPPNFTPTRTLTIITALLLVRILPWNLFMSFLFFLENFCKRHVHPVLLHPFSKTIPYSQVRILPTNLAHRISLKSSYTLRSVQECMRLETDSNIVPRRSRGTNTSVFLLNGTVQHKPFNLQTLN